MKDKYLQQNLNTLTVRRKFALKVLALITIAVLEIYFILLERNLQHVRTEAIEVLTLIGLITGFFVFFFDSPEQSKSFELLRAESSTKKYHKNFPYYLTYIIDLVKDANKTLCIMADCVDYGSFSNPVLHEDLVSAIEESKADKPQLSVKIILTEQPQPISKSSKFYGLEFDELKNNSDFIDVLNEYLKFHNESMPDDERKFIAMLQIYQMNVWKRLKKADVEILINTENGTRLVIEKDFYFEPKLSQASCTKRKFDLFFWTVDGNEAIFSFAHTGPKVSGSECNALKVEAREMAFRTLDPMFVEHVFDHIFRKTEMMRLMPSTLPT